jgi:hypothetical protein
VSSMTFTASSASMANFVITFEQGWGFSEPDEGTAGVREPRRPQDPSSPLVARRQSDGTWEVPLAITGGGRS